MPAYIQNTTTGRCVRNHHAKISRENGGVVVVDGRKTSARSFRLTRSASQRCPTAVTPSSFSVSCVRLARTDSSILITFKAEAPQPTTYIHATEVLRARRADLDDGSRLLLAQETVTADQFPAIRFVVDSRTVSEAHSVSYRRQPAELFQVPPDYAPSLSPYNPQRGRTTFRARLNAAERYATHRAPGPRYSVTPNFHSPLSRS
jgi:hypothetical protein